MVFYYPPLPASNASTLSVTVTCTSQTQLCSPPYTFSESRTLFVARFTVGRFHCSPMRLHVLMDGNEVLVTRWLGWPGAPPPYNSWPLIANFILITASGTHQIGFQAEGMTAGCNSGYVGSWAGTFNIVWG